MSVQYAANIFEFRRVRSYHIVRDALSMMCGVIYRESDYQLSPFTWETRTLCPKCEKATKR